nr:hypothetical protein B0A51_02211 [Rachicladosporium sp. CCFEE 5018]
MSNTTQMTDDNLTMGELFSNVCHSAYTADSTNTITMTDNIEYKNINADDFLPEFIRNAITDHAASRQVKKLRAVIAVAREWAMPVEDQSQLIQGWKRDGRFVDMSGKRLNEYLDVLEASAARLQEPALPPLSIREVGWIQPGEQRLTVAFKKPNPPKRLVAEIEEVLIEDVVEEVGLPVLPISRFSLTHLLQPAIYTMDIADSHSIVHGAETKPTTHVEAMD